ncbi:type II toxin-antitoxin system VapC family toxin [Nocardia otitidiscaviarum]|uniref:Ribonuclease VapC n=1 Tax=Nocardia otitidiscaviarum TaxID=1823 RepID=A0A516NP80_9NOCA|nr:type II toxin-antitoxin system VapC family toxin [Nocardia otitidiscaviarum]MCP9624027.1 type II toxin-antitoxin system VapC family toxin [Nocardia otitidiscaviarum]QDP80706.1 type II toxin-antitoxin system VapC family toxin [Nocardia otitidiscaviarum]
MNFLLDTNAVSEWVKPQPNRGLADWFDSIDEDRTFLSVVTLGELRRGVDRLPDGKRRERLSAWLTEEVPDRFAGRLLPIDEVVALAWGRLRARVDVLGRCVDPVDGLIAATAESHGLTIVTRNVRDFEVTGVPIVDPWTR